MAACLRSMELRRGDDGSTRNLTSLYGLVSKFENHSGKWLVAISITDIIILTFYSHSVKKGKQKPDNELPGIW